MPYVGPERDIGRSKELRKLAQGMKDPTAKRHAEEAANRMEQRAGRNLAKIGRKRLRKRAEGRFR